MIGIYKITNQINGKCYIGQSIDIEKRWKQHISDAKNSNRKKCPYFHKALIKYGIENFKFEILEECLIDKLNEREIYWIKFYNSYENGYNLTPGGNQSIWVNPDEIYTLWDIGYSVGEIYQLLNGKYCRQTITSYLQRYDNYNEKESKRRGRLKAKKTLHNNEELYCIKQYSFFGDFIKNWETTYEIERVLNIPHSSVSAVLNGKNKQTASFQWRWGSLEDKQNVSSLEGIAPMHFEIIQKDKNGKEVKRFKSLEDAAKEVKTSASNIAKVLKKQNNRKTAGGYIWEYDLSNWIG